MAPLLYLAGLLLIAGLFAAFHAIETGPRRPPMSDANTRQLAFAVADSVRATTPNFTPPPSRRFRWALVAAGALVVIAPWAVLFLARCLSA